MPRLKQVAREQTMSETRQGLLQAAMIEFAREGYANANINDISVSAGFAKGTIYNYFPSKAELMLALIRETGAFHLEFIREYIHLEQDPCLRLERFYEAGFKFVELYPTQAQFLITTLYGANLQFKQAMYTAYLPMFQLVAADILNPGMLRGVFQPMDAVRIAGLIMSIYLGTSSNVDEDGKVWLDAPEVSSFVLRAIQR